LVIDTCDLIETKCPTVDNKTRWTATYVWQEMKKLLQKHKKHIYEYGMDMEEVANWKWTAWNNNIRSSWCIRNTNGIPRLRLALLLVVVHLSGIMISRSEVFWNHYVIIACIDTNCIQRSKRNKFARSGCFSSERCHEAVDFGNTVYIMTIFSVVVVFNDKSTNVVCDIFRVAIRRVLYGAQNYVPVSTDCDDRFFSACYQ
jgi:hypothetical protein